MLQLQSKRGLLSWTPSVVLCVSSLCLVFLWCCIFLPAPFKFEGNLLSKEIALLNVLVRMHPAEVARVFAKLFVPLQIMMIKRMAKVLRVRTTLLIGVIFVIRETLPLIVSGVWTPF